ncbi:MAG: rod shape-determining protein MreD [Nitrosomonas sp.]|nr:rod shape-determining protein MreD [Nitrosomonas sp.]MCC7134976.1 rod shape-determining protein MreD [Nitrosomonas sp.]
MPIKPASNKAFLHENLLEQELHLSASRPLIYLSLVAALMLNLLVSENITLLVRPDFIALAVLYWNIHQPRQSGMSLAFVSGIIMDVVTASIMGQHALAYCLLTFFALLFYRRLRMFSVFRQIPAILWMLLLSQIILLLIGMLTGTYLPDWHILLRSVSGGLIWPFIAITLTSLRKQEINPDEL